MNDRAGWKRRRPRYPAKTLKGAREFFYRHRDEIFEAFRAQCPCPTGGLCNPLVVDVEHGDLVIRCHYDNYNNEEDSWMWRLDPVSMRFY